jgi:prolyl oligopeptidase
MQSYPDTARDEQVDDLHGVKVPDPYRWLEDGQNDAVKKWVSSQDAYARTYLAKLPLRDTMAARFKELFYVESASAPRRFGKAWFYGRRDAGREKGTVYFRQGKEAPERVLLDPNTWSEDGSVALGVWNPSWDGKKVAYAVKGNNSDEATLHVLDVESGKKESDVIEGAKYAWPSWTPSGSGFYYVWVPPPGAVPTAGRIRRTTRSSGRRPGTRRRSRTWTSRRTAAGSC